MSFHHLVNKGSCDDLAVENKIFKNMVQFSRDKFKGGISKLKPNFHTNSTFAFWGRLLVTQGTQELPPPGSMPSHGPSLGLTGSFKRTL